MLDESKRILNTLLNLGDPRAKLFSHCPELFSLICDDTNFYAGHLNMSFYFKSTRYRLLL
jgi:hypothetical protein